MAEIKKLAPHEKMSMEEAFPDVSPHMKPFGNQVIVQIVCMRKRSAGGIILTESDREFGKTQSRVARVVSMGLLAYMKRDELDEKGQRVQWPEGPWVKLGDFVRIPAYSGADRWTIRILDEMATKQMKDSYEAELSSLNEELLLAQGRNDEQAVEKLRSDIRMLHKPESVYKGVQFAAFNDYDMKMGIDGDPLEVVDYI